MRPRRNGSAVGSDGEEVSGSPEGGDGDPARVEGEGDVLDFGRRLAPVKRVEMVNRRRRRVTRVRQDLRRMRRKEMGEGQEEKKIEEENEGAHAKQTRTQAGAEPFLTLKIRASLTNYPHLETTARPSVNRNARTRARTYARLHNQSSSP